MIGHEPVGAWDVEFAAPVGLRNLVHNDMPVWSSMEVGQQHQGGVGDEQNLTIERRVLQVLDDVGNNLVAGLAVDGSAPNLGHEAGEVFHGFGDEENARLDDQNLLAESGYLMGVSDGIVGLGTATSSVDVEIGSQVEYSNLKKEPARAGGTLRVHWSVFLSGSGQNWPLQQLLDYTKLSASARSHVLFSICYYILLHPIIQLISW